MTVLRNNFTAGPDGTRMTPANTGANDDDAFDTMNNGSGTTVCSFADAGALGRATAEFVLEVATGATTFAPLAIWNVSLGSQSQIWTRMYLMFPVLPTSATKPVVFYEAMTSGGALYCCNIGLDKSTYQIYITDKNDPGLGFSVQTTGAITAGQWFRVESRQQFSTTTGNVELRWFDGDDADSDIPTETISFTGKNLGASATAQWAYGYGYSDSNWESMYLSGIELNNTGWPGPAPFRAGKGVPGILSNPVAIHTDIW